MKTESLLILGATSAVASEVARIHVARGDRLHLLARSQTKLQPLLLLGAEGQVTGSEFDALDSTSSEEVVKSALRSDSGFDRILIAYGELGSQLESESDGEEAARILAVNFTSVVRLLVPIANDLETRGTGRLCVITSVAGERGRPRNYTYGAAKGGLSIYLEGLRSRLYARGVSVTTIKLGPVDSPMTVSHAKNLTFSEPEDVARAIVKAMDRRQGNVFVPGYWRLVLAVVRALPEWAFQKLSFLSGK